MKEREYYIYACSFSEYSKKLYDFKSKDLIEVGTNVIIKCRDYITKKDTFREVTIKEFKGIKELSEREEQFYKLILSAEGDD